MTTLTLETDLLAAQVRVTEEKLIVNLVDGRSLIIPLNWYPHLLDLSKIEYQGLIGEHSKIKESKHWSVHISISKTNRKPQEE